MQHENGAVGGRDEVEKVGKALDQVGLERLRRGRGYGFEYHFVPHLFRPPPLSPERSESLPARYAVRPRLEELRLFEPVEFSIDEQQDFLEHVFGDSRLSYQAEYV